MKSTVKKILLFIVLILMIFLFLNRSKIFYKRHIVLDKELDITTNARDFHLSTNSIMVFDGRSFFICDKTGSLIKSIPLKDRELEVYFANNFAFLYDRNLKKLYEYKENGEFLGTLKSVENLYNITYNNKNIIMHFKNGDRESLKVLRSDGSLEDLYESPNIILTYDFYEDYKNFAVEEIKKEASGYQNILKIYKDSKKIKEENSFSEVALYIKRLKNETIVVTDKNLKIYGDKEKLTKDIPNVSDVLVMDKNIYLLHSGILSRYNFKLEEKEKLILAANVYHLERVSNSIYAYGDSDIGLDLFKRTQTYTRLPSALDKIEISGLTIGTLKDGRINLYKITNDRNLNKEDKSNEVGE